ncbi:MULTISPECIES: hypothetical protein [Bradyrhizobium]|uniref:hypothetical protein n=1 Tax=Bradyrhizobium TaxID=374 RepID=UPI001B8A7258|nr:MULTISPECIES: hypothetical protein [Bradyrhizobium]MBR0975315.1 hypothetical protein [Bradyrhizobium japonicum]
MPADFDSGGIADRETLVRRLLRRAVGRVRRPRKPAPEVPFGRESDPNVEFADRQTGGTAWLLGALSVFVAVYAIWTKLGAS